MVDFGGFGRFGNDFGGFAGFGKAILVVLLGSAVDFGGFAGFGEVILMVLLDLGGQLTLSRNQLSG